MRCDPRILARVLAAFALISWSVIAACAGFAATILYGVYAGYALPTTAVFRLFDEFHLESVELFVPYAVLAFAAAGTGLRWFWCGDPVSGRLIRRGEIALIRLWSRWGLPVIACMFLFAMSAGGWSGHVRSSDLNYMSIGGLLPNSDPQWYFTDAFRLAYVDGHWGVLGSRRPLAEAFRQVIVFLAQYSYVATLLIQAGILAILAFSAAQSVARWRGIWAGIAFFGFTFLFERPYLTTTLTEPLGFGCGLLSLIFFIEALRRRSLPHAVIALIALTAALLMRMGSLFTIPMLVLWTAFFLGRGRQWRVFAAGCAAVLLVVALQGSLAWLYGSNQAATAGNFAYTICGLSLGTDWSDCFYRRYAAEISRLPDERAVVWFLFARTWENFMNNPEVLTWRSLENAAKFIVSQPRYLLPGYGPWSLWTKIIAGLAMLALLPGLLYSWHRRASTAEQSFWVVLFVSVIMSAAFIYADDGWRVLHVTHVFAACFWSLAFAAPGVVTSPNLAIWPRRWQSGAALIAVMAALFLVVPMLARELARRELGAHPSFSSLQPNEVVVLGGRHVSGFLVVSDDAVLPTSFPALRISEFVRLVHLTTLEPESGPFSRDVIGRIPFAFVFAPAPSSGLSNLYVASPRLLEEPGVWAWRIKIRTWRAREDAWTSIQDAVAVESLPD